MRRANSCEQGHFSFLAISTKISAIISGVGEGTLMPRQRDFNGSIIFEEESHIRINRHCEEYLIRSETCNL